MKLKAERGTPLGEGSPLLPQHMNLKLGKWIWTRIRMSYDCPHGDDPNMCPPCQSPPRGKTRAIKATSDVSRMNARFKSQCPSCMKLIHIDDPIVRLEEGWVHEETCSS